MKNIDTKALVEKLLSASKEYAEKGQDVLEEKLNIPESGPEREQMLDGLKKGAAATALLVGLLGTKGGRKLSGLALKLGGVAALGTAAYKGYQDWQEKHGNNLARTVNELEGEEAQKRGLLLITAMVSAASADGDINDDEQTRIKKQILDLHLADHLADDLRKVVDAPLSVADLAAQVENMAEATEVYMATKVIIDENSSEKEKTYLAELVKALKIESTLQEELDKQVV